VTKMSRVHASHRKVSEAVPEGLQLRLRWSEQQSRPQLLLGAQRELGTDTGSFESLLTHWCQGNALGRDWREPLATAMIDWASRRGEFFDVRHRVHYLLSEPPAAVDLLELVELRRLLSSMGFFSTSPTLLTHIVERIFKSRKITARRHIRAEIATGAITRTTEVFRFRSLGLGALTRAYFDMVRPSPQLPVTKPTHVICGPAPIGEITNDFDADSVTVCRVMMPGVTEWVSGDPLSGRADIAYLNGMTAKWVGSLAPPQREEVLTSAESIRVSSNHGWMKRAANAKSAAEIKSLYLTGSPNMIPTMVVDQFVDGAKHIYVVGTSFFLGSSPYRESQRRDFPEQGKKSDAFGSTGSEFERCKSMASHDQLVNRAVVKNLFLAGKLTGDDNFTRAIGLSDQQFMNELEETYGPARR